MKYAQNLVPILLNHLAQTGTDEHSFERWFIIFRMADEALFDSQQQEDIRFFSQLSPFQLQKLVYMVDALCRRTLINTLNALKKDQIVTYSVREYIVTGATRHLASAEEIHKMQQCKDQAMAAVDASSMFAVQINPARRIQFYEVLNGLYRTQCGWDRTYSLLEIVPLDTETVHRYVGMNVQSEMAALNSSIKYAVISQLHAACEKADQKMLEEWENNISPQGFKLDHMTAEMLIHILQDEL